MFGRVVRAIALLAISPVVAAFLKFVLGSILEHANAPQDSMIGTMFVEVQQHILLLLILSVLIYLIVGAVIERGVAAR